MSEKVYDMAGEPKPEWATVCDARPTPNTRVLLRYWRYEDGRAGYYLDYYKDGELSSMRPFKFLSEARAAAREYGVDV